MYTKPSELNLEPINWDELEKYFPIPSGGLIDLFPELKTKIIEEARRLLLESKRKPMDTEQPPSPPQRSSRRTFTKAFKKSLVEQVLNGSLTYREIRKQHQIDQPTFFRWKREQKQGIFDRTDKKDLNNQAFDSEEDRTKKMIEVIDDLRKRVRRLEKKQ